MPINHIINQIAINNGMHFEIIILILTCVGCLIFMAKDVKLGLLLLFLISALNFMLDHYLGLNYTPALIVCFMSLIMLSFTFYAVNKAARYGMV